MHARSVCGTHYARLQTAPGFVPRTQETTKQRLARSTVVAANGCWEWMGYIKPNGYGQISIKDKHHYTHRASWGEHRGPIPAGAWVLHKCDNRRCINPDHLFLGDAAANNQDAADKGRKPRGSAHPMAKLTVDDVRKIRHIGATADLPQWAIAQRFGVTQTLISQILAGRVWAWLDD